jgi:hypothetical protein
MSVAPRRAPPMGSSGDGPGVLHQGGSGGDPGALRPGANGDDPTSCTWGAAVVVRRAATGPVPVAPRRASLRGGRGAGGCRSSTTSSARGSSGGGPSELHPGALASFVGGATAWRARWRRDADRLKMTLTCGIHMQWCIFRVGQVDHDPP